MISPKQSRFRFKKSSYVSSKKISTKGRFQQSGLLLMACLIAFTITSPAYTLQVFNTLNPAKVQRGAVRALESPYNSPVALPSMDDADKFLLSNQEMKPTKTNREHKVARELVEERKSHSKTFLNTDGTKTLEYTSQQRHYQEKGKSAWKEIDNTLTQKKALDGSRYFEGSAGGIASAIKRISQGVSVDAEGKKIVVKPAGANDVQPERIDEQTVIYRNVWPNVDIEYELRGESVKEIIVVRNKNAPTTFNFNVSGGKVIQHPDRKGELAIQGLSDEYSFSALTLDVNGRGVISEERVTQTPTSSGISVDLDDVWFRSQSDSAFPMRIDPTFTKTGDSNFSYKMFKSDGYQCNASNCYINTGSVNDNGWKHWRSAAYFDYSSLNNKTVLNAKIEGTFKSGIGGTTASKTIYIGHIACINSYSCSTAGAGSAATTTNYNVNFTDKVKALVDAKNWSAWWSIRGQEGSSLSYKPYSNTKVTITYDTPTPMATASLPANGATVVTTQPMLQVNNVTDPDGDAVKYFFRVSTNPDGETGAVINSGWITSREWTVPENILQDGTTYYWHTYTQGSADTPPNWVRSFKVDLRTGKNSTQAYEEVGPIAVDLATGNATTSTGSHSISALGGDIGLTLNYNTPALVHTGTAHKSLAKYGMVGYYYNDPSGSKSFPSNVTDPDRLMMVRRDQRLAFSWTTGGPAPGLPADRFLVRWKGYLTVPENGTYTLGANSDDGVRVKLGTGAGGADETVIDAWVDGSSTKWGASKYLTAGQQVPITVEYYENAGWAKMFLFIKGGSLAGEQDVPVTWITPNANVLPDGWELAMGDGGVNFERLYTQSSSATLSDSTGQKYEYKWDESKKSYQAPVNQEAILLRNSDNTHTVLDTDGRTYIFDAEGKLTSVTAPEDDRQPAALKYEYAGNPSRLVKISDGVNTARNGTLHYAGDSACEVKPTFHAAPVGFLCAFKTTDGKKTTFQYYNGNLARIISPGDEQEDYQYDSLGRITTYRDALANDTIAYGVRADDVSTRTQFSYNGSGKVTAIKAPAPTAGAAREEQTVVYNSGNTVFHTTGVPEPHGFSRKVTYDSTFRKLTDTDVANLTTTTQWVSDTKDLVASVTDPTGMKSTTIYDSDDRPTDSYGPAPAAWFDGGVPLAAHTNDIPRTQTKYDEGINGAAIAWYNFKNDSLVGAPLRHTLGFNKHEPTKFWINTSNPSSPQVPVTPTDGATHIGFRATGKIHVPTSGTYSIALYHANAVRLIIDDKVVADGWSYRSNGVISKTASVVMDANKPSQFVLEYSNVGGGDTAVRLDISGNGISTPNSIWNSLMRPTYGLQTSSTVYDMQAGNLNTKTTYGLPEYGQVGSVAVDSSGLNLQTTSEYEAPNTGFLRQTAKTLPGGSKTMYEYYSATETRNNPCDGSSSAVLQAGRIKKKTDPDPDGAGSQVGRTTETVYDATGKVVAERYNSDAWTCFTYDSRGREVTQIIPGVSGRTITNNYLVGNTPLKTSVSDNRGTVMTEKDLLGRVVSYADINGKVTTTSYNARGLVATKVSPVGTETFEYDNYDRLTIHKLDGVTYATVTYDAYGRESGAVYTEGISSSINRDSLGRENGVTYSHSGGQTLTDSVTYSQGGKIMSGTENGKSKSYTYDASGRLSAANIDGNTFTYGFGAASGSCSGLTGNNVNAGKSGNRTSQTVNGQTTTYCYDQADRLIGSSSDQYNVVEYDNHGNTTKLGSGTKELVFGYDVSDRNTSIAQGNRTVSYERDVNDRVSSREVKESGNTTSYVKYGYSEDDENDSPSYLLDSSDAVVEKYISLPGDILVTIRPGKTGAEAKTTSLPNIHGDVMATIDASGVLSNTHMTGPFGEPLPNVDTPENTVEGSSYGYVGQHQKTTETDFIIPVIQMGARVYLPTLGRFLQVDPVEGGVDNSYVYPTQPVTGYDLTGEWGWLKKAGDLAWKYKWDIALTTVSFVPGGAVIGIVGKAAMIARAANAGRKLGKASKLTSNIAGKMFVGKGATVTTLKNGSKRYISKSGLKSYRTPAVKSSGSRVSNLEKFKARPHGSQNNNSYKYPNRYYDGHLRIR